jgi:hypothetical protein
MNTNQISNDSPTSPVNNDCLYGTEIDDTSIPDQNIQHLIHDLYNCDDELREELAYLLMSGKIKVEENEEENQSREEFLSENDDEEGDDEKDNVEGKDNVEEKDKVVIFSKDEYNYIKFMMDSVRRLDKTIAPARRVIYDSAKRQLKDGNFRFSKPECSNIINMMEAVVDHLNSILTKNEIKQTTSKGLKRKDEEEKEEHTKKRARLGLVGYFNSITKDAIDNGVNDFLFPNLFQKLQDQLQQNQLQQNQPQQDQPQQDQPQQDQPQQDQPQQDQPQQDQ